MDTTLKHLHQAAKDGDVNEINRLLEAGESVNEKDGQGDTPLHWAVFKNSKPAIKLLVYNGADTLASDGKGKSPLTRANAWWGYDLEKYIIQTRKDYFELQDLLRRQVLIGDFQKFLDLIQYPGQINGYLADGHTFLQEAVRTGSYDFIRKLLSRGAAPSLKDLKGRTALHDAARAGSVEAIHELLQEKADIEARDNDGRTPLHDAARADSVEAIRELLQEKADTEARDNNGRTPLHDAARAGSVGAIREILQEKADTEARDNNGRTPLHDVVRPGSVKAIHELLWKKPDTKAKDNNGRTALHDAARADSVEAIHELLQERADIEAKDNNGRTALHDAARAGLVEAIRKLLREKADTKARDNDGRTPLHDAVRAGSVGAIYELLRKRADIEAKDNNGRTPLHDAARAGLVEAIRELLLKNADTEARDNNGRTPLHDAARADSVEAIHELLQERADIEAKDNNGLTALHDAALAGSVKAIHELLQEKAGIEARDNDRRTPLHDATRADSVEAIRQLLRGAYVALTHPFHSVCRYILILIQRQEPPLMSGMTRIRWICVCQRHLYSDVKEILPGAAEEIQTALCSIYQKSTNTDSGALAFSNEFAPRHLGNFSNTIASSSNVAVDRASDRQEGKGKRSDSTIAGASEFSTTQGQTPRSMEPSEMKHIEEDDDQRPMDSRQGIELIRRYIYPCFKCSKYWAKAEPLEISNIEFDAHLFTALRKRYFAERSYFWRFFELREVKEIHYVQFDLTAVNLASIRRKNVWPTEDDRDYDRWEYRPFPAPCVPLIPAEHLMHLWRNPHHIDWEVYRAWQNETGHLQRWLDWFRNFIARIREPSLPVVDLPPSNLPLDPDKPIPPNRKKFVFLRTPKRVGHPLDHDYGDDDPEGWGMLFEEGFQIHRLLFAILIFYFLGSLGFIISIIVKFGPILPSTWPTLIAFWSWVNTFLALTVTVWFKWAES